MKKLILLLTIFYISTCFVLGQNTLTTEKDKDDDWIEARWGPNLRHFRHWYFDFGFILDEPEGDGININHGKSNTFTVGYRYKLKFNNFLSSGLDLHYNKIAYNIKQDSAKIIPNEIIHEFEKINFMNLGFEYYFRLNFGKRGNIVGMFVDIGIYYNWNYRTKHIYEDIVDQTISPYMSKSVRVINNDLNYTEQFNYGLNTRIGLNKWGISLTYRLSTLFNETFDAELPRLSIGLQIGLHR